MISMPLTLMPATPTACPSQNVLAPPLKGWAFPSSGSTLAFGQPARLTLSVGKRFPLTARKAPGLAGHGGTASSSVAQHGIYEMAVSVSAWVDIIGRGGAIQSNSHRHGPECTSIRKIVAFPLEPGGYILLLSGSVNAEVTVAIYQASPQDR